MWCCAPGSPQARRMLAVPLPLDLGGTTCCLPERNGVPGKVVGHVDLHCRVIVSEDVASLRDLDRHFRVGSNGHGLVVDQHGQDRFGRLQRGEVRRTCCSA